MINYPYQSLILLSGWTVAGDHFSIYSLNLDQAEIIMLVSGYIPYVVFESDPEIPDGEFLWIHYEPADNDFIPPIDPFPCRILSYVSFANQIHILTLAPDEFDLDFLEMIEEFKANMEKVGECVRSTASLSHDALS